MTFFSSLGNLKIYFHFQNKTSITFRVTFTFCRLIVEFDFVLKKEETELEKKSKVKPRKSKFEPEQI